MKKNFITASLLVLVAGLLCACNGRKTTCAEEFGVISDEESVLVTPNQDVVMNNELLTSPEPTSYHIQFCPGDGVKCEGEVVIGGKKYSYAGTKSMGGKDYLIVH